MTPGSLVRYREREWVVLPSDEPDLILLRPIGGSAREVCGVHRELATLMASSLPFERVSDAQFPPPDPTRSQDHTAVQMMLDAARLLLRDGAAPFRSLGHLSVRPRPYQFVPLLMALRQDTVRLLIADSVGVGKTVEGLAVAAELLARGEARRLGVLCPPYLCDQWHRELAEKFQIEAEVIRSGTVARLERLTPPDRSIFEYHPHFVASIDTVKGGRYRKNFIQHCPDLVIVDEVHAAARPPGDRRSRSQQQRHDLLCEIAADRDRHLIMLTATPHSGVEESFLSLLGLLDPAFERLDLANLSDEDRDELAKCFIQRRRPDVQRWMGKETPFPERDPSEEPYTFSPAYREYYRDVYQFARGLVQSAEGMTGWKARMRFWSALALLRCVTSSPAAAEASLLRRLGGEVEMGVEALDEASDEELQATFEPQVYDPSDAEAAVDAPPSAVFEAQEQDPALPDSERRKLREFARRASALQGEPDSKMDKAAAVVRKLLSDGYHPIVWCRYIATSDYVAEELQRRLSKAHCDLRVVSVTGTMSEDERRLQIDELAQYPRRVLVATDCLSEGVNLQEHFNAVVHYDLPWNPNRLEQREGRVDRFGQTSPQVRTVLIFGQDNPVDGAVLSVLLRKARDIHRDLGIYVPVPMSSETVMEAVLRSVFAKNADGSEQLSLFDDSDMAAQAVKQFDLQLRLAADRERETRSRFAQRRIKPEEVQRELEETDSILGDPGAVRRFLQEASQRMGFAFRDRGKGVWHLGLQGLPDSVRQSLGDRVPDPLPIAFDTPVPEGVVYVGRSHRLVETLAEHLMDQAFYPTEGTTSAASRTGVIQTKEVARLTTLLLLRLRYLVYERDDGPPGLAEETLVWGYRGLTPSVEPLSLEESRALMDTACPTANVSPQRKEEVLRDALSDWEWLQDQLRGVVTERAGRLEESHKRIRSLTKQGQVRIEPKMPPDLLGVLVLLPVPKGAAR